MYFPATLELQESVSQPIIVSFISPPFFFIVTIDCKAHNKQLITDLVPALLQHVEEGRGTRLLLHKKQYKCEY